VSAEPRHFELGGFALETGATLPGARIAYTTYGELNQARDNAIVWPTWFTGTHAEHEWMVGPGDALDTSRFFVVIPSMFGNGLSSSPSNTPAPFDGPRFPHHTIRDNVRAQHRLLTEELGVERIRLVIGGSMGAFQAFQWGLSHPDLVERIMPCCGASRVSRHCYVFLWGIKAALLADPAFAGGEYDAPPEAGLRAAGRVYAGWGLSQEFYALELYRQLGHDSVDDFLVNFWEAWTTGLDANDMLSQIHTWQDADLAATPGYDGDIERALGDVRARAFLCPGQKDLYFPPEDMAREAELMPNAELRALPGPWGHQSDAGLDPACMDEMRRNVRDLLSEQVPA
jgi:homoserine O-acetyltransferase/O-succinyltransferase